jgi:rod shape-determining protein MreC
LISEYFDDMKFNITLFIIFFILVGVLFSLPDEKTNSVSTVVRDVFAVPQTGLCRATGWIRSLGHDKAELLNENKLLRARIEELKNEARHNSNIQEENRKLRDLLKVKAASRHTLLVAQLLSRDVNGWWQMARIDKGADDGVRPDLPVISQEGLIGQIVEVSRNSADMLFLTSPKVKVAARLARSDIFGIVRGQGVSLEGDAKCRMDFILKGADINRADEVVTSGLGGVYPEGLVIGYVENVQMDSSGLFQYAELVPAADFRLIDMVFVLLPEKKEDAIVKNGRKKEAR